MREFNSFNPFLLSLFDVLNILFVNVKVSKLTSSIHDSYM